jgi:SAM-dependent methyltransferase
MTISSAPAEVAAATPAQAVGRNSTRAHAILLSVTVFLSAFLLFIVEPLFAKLILSWFGGSAAVWSTCLVFFQCALLLGYLYADLTSRRLLPVQQSFLHIALLLASLLFLPIAPHSSWRPQQGSDPAWRILGLLTASIGLPFVLLSATSPLLQMWYARRNSTAEPYHLFALSNFASMLALLSFPLLVEPHIASHKQAVLWSVLFAIFVILCSMAAWNARRSITVELASRSEPTGPAAAPSAREKLLWLGLSACGSMLLLSITNHLLENIAPVPLLWVLPLALYLLTFTLAFSRRRLYSHWLMVRLLAVALGSVGYAVYKPSFATSVQLGVPFFGIGLFVCCLFCHGELALHRPAARYVTLFYLMISLGGALGAIFVGLVAPRLFTSIYEFPLTLVFIAVLAMAALWREGWLPRIFWAVAAAALIVVLVRNMLSYQEDTILSVRNFYAPLSVKQLKNSLEEPYRALYHGRIEHGAQFVNPPSSLLATTYYAPDSGVGLALTHCCPNAKRVGAIGLGAGTLAAYGKTSDYFRFYEINPQVVAIAESSFSYLRDSPARIDVVLGDARLSLQNEAPQQFDVLAVDAFSGDAIPVHLLTKEAMEIYLRHLKPEGVLAFHTSSEYLYLSPVVQLLADDAGYSTRWITGSYNQLKLVATSNWVLVTRNGRFLNDVDSLSYHRPILVPPHLRLWTDDYNNLFQILRPVSAVEPVLR